MQYLKYLWRSFGRRKSWHFTLYVILTNALILPLLFCIYLDSSKYGRSQQFLSESLGETYHITDITEKDCELFENIEGLSNPRYEDGKIYLHILDEDEWKQRKRVEYYGTLLMQLAGSERMITVRGFEYDYAHGIPTQEDQAKYRSIFLISLISMMITAFIIRSAYRNHLGKFSAEIGILYASGARQSQVTVLFFVEYLILYFASAVSAVIIAGLVMKGIFALYLEISDIKGLVWVIFYMNPRSTLLYITIFGVIVLVTLLRPLSGIRKQTINQLLHDIHWEEKPTVKVKKSEKKWVRPYKMLSDFWMWRSNHIVKSCVWLIVPVAVMFLFLFGYLSVDIQFISQSKEYALRLQKNVYVYGGFTQQEIDTVTNHANVKAIESKCENLTDVFAQKEDSLYIDTIFVQLYDNTMHRTTKEELLSELPRDEIVLDDFEETAEYSREVSKGIYLMLVFLFLTSFLFVLIIIWAKLCDYVDMHKQNIGILLTIGSSKEAVYRSYIRQVGVAARNAIICSNIISILMIGYVVRSIEASYFSIDLMQISAFLITDILIVAGFLYPMHRKLKRILSDIH